MVLLRMSFGLCNALGKFQRCMMAIFSNRVERTIKEFRDDFSMVGTSFDDSLTNLEFVLVRCEETNLVVNWEKCLFMVKEDIILGHKISEKGIEVDKAKIETIEKLCPPTSVKGIKSFLGHARFYKRFIKDFPRFLNLFQIFLFRQLLSISMKIACKHSPLKEKLISVPIVVASDLELPFELMYNAVIMSWGRLWDKEETRYSMLSTMQVELSMMPN